MIVVSVIVCTYRRPDALAACLTSLESQDFPQDKYEVVVVDQGTEGISQLIKKYRDKRHFRFISEEVLGLSTARNTGIVQARSDYIAFIDDDAVAAPNWLSSLMNCHRDDSVGIVGGRILPMYTDGVNMDHSPSDYVRSLLSLFDLGDEDRLVSRVFGCNFSVRKRVFSEVGGFDTRSGRKGDLLLSGEETEFCERVSGRYKVVYCADAVVHHKISKERLSLSWLVKRSYYGGLSKGLQGRRRRPIDRMHLTWFDYILLVPYLIGLLIGMFHRVVWRR